jgi:hypothetical protein
MERPPLVPIVLFVSGLVLLAWGLTAADSLSSEVSEAVQGAPSDKAIALIVIGGLLGATGLVKLLRRA